jgi:hypothetical protein
MRALGVAQARRRQPHADPQPQQARVYTANQTTNHATNPPPTTQLKP